MNVPTDLKYTKTHEWVRVEGQTATVGITDHAQSELGDVVFVELPSVGRTLAAEESFGTVESVKTVTDVYSPVSGVISEVNEALTSQSELLNTDPYGAGWLIKISMSNPSEVEGLLGPSEYEAEASSH